jgi:histone demethylase JARID1
MVIEETARRDKLRAAAPLITEILVEEDCPEEQYQCCICKGFCYLSQVTCTCTKLVACVEHADQLCGCSKTKRALKKRYSEAQLEEILSIVEARANQPQSWKERLYALMETPRPALKSMRALLSDGEKIAHCMEEVNEGVRGYCKWLDREGHWGIH